MKEKIGIIGIGQTGNNIIRLIANKGYDYLAINSSKADLNPLKFDEKNIFHFPNSEGANQDRAYGQYLASLHKDAIIAKIRDIMPNKKVIYIACSTSGGTGGAALTFLLPELYEVFPETTFCAVVVLPSMSEALQFQVNAYDCYTELTNSPYIGSVFTLDNNKLDKFLINHEFSECFDAMCRIPEHESQLGNVDGSEMINTLKIRGNTIVTRFKFDIQQGSNSLVQQIIHSWQQHIFADIEDDRKIRKITLLLPERIDETQLQQYFGKALPKVSIGYSKDEVITVLSGLTFTQKRYDAIGNILNDNKDLVKEMRSKKAALKNKVVKKLSWLDEDEDEDEFPTRDEINSENELDDIRILEEQLSNTGNKNRV